jgi:hypothetical protein
MDFSQDGYVCSDSNSDQYESGQKSEGLDFSENDNSSTYQERDLHDNSNVITLEEKSDVERFDPTKCDDSFSLEGSMAAYCQKYFYQHLTDDSI